MGGVVQLFEHIFVCTNEYYVRAISIIIIIIISIITCNHICLWGAGDIVSRFDIEMGRVNVAAAKVT